MVLAGARNGALVINWTNGPAFVVWSSMLRYDLRGGYRAQFSIENLFNESTGNEYAVAVRLPASQP